MSHCLDMIWVTALFVSAYVVKFVPVGHSFNEGLVDEFVNNPSSALIAYSGVSVAVLYLAIEPASVIGELNTGKHRVNRVWRPIFLQWRIIQR